jgi:hypothetical protein
MTLAAFARLIRRNGVAFHVDVVCSKCMSYETLRVNAPEVSTLGFQSEFRWIVVSVEA